MPRLKTFGSILRSWRTKRDMTQGELERKMGWTTGQVSRIEGGHFRRTPDFETCARLDQALGQESGTSWSYAAAERLKAMDPHLYALFGPARGRPPDAGSGSFTEAERTVVDLLRDLDRSLGGEVPLAETLETVLLSLSVELDGDDVDAGSTGVVKDLLGAVGVLEEVPTAVELQVYRSFTATLRLAAAAADANGGS